MTELFYCQYCNQYFEEMDMSNPEEHMCKLCWLDRDNTHFKKKNKLAKKSYIRNKKAREESLNGFLLRGETKL